MAIQKLMKAIEIFGEKYFLRKTFDILEYYGGTHGFDVFDEDKAFLFHHDGENKKDLVSEIKRKIYRSF